jgi:hypothetical protein
VAVTGQIVLGAVWWALNLNNIPHYGDTPEYIHLAGTLRVDSYRTLAYPIVVKLGYAFNSQTGMSWTLPIYLLQTIIAAWAAWYLVGTILPEIQRRPRFFISAGVLTFPLTLHYTVSILTDSLATSFFILSICALARMVSYIRIDNRTLIAAVTGTLGTIGAVILRPEKFYIILILVCVCAVYVLFRSTASLRAGRPANLPIALSSIGIIFVAFALPGLAVSAFNHSTQTAQLGRPPATLAGSLYDRVVWPHLEEIRGQLPPSVQAALPPSYVTLPSASIVPNRIAVLAAFRASGGGGDEQTMKAVWQTLDCCSAGVARESVVDITKSFAAPITLVIDWVSGRGGATSWNLSRMSEAHPVPSLVYLLWSTVLSFLVIAAAVSHLFSRGSRRFASFAPAATVWILIGGTLVNAIFFGLVTSLDVNLRYALSNYMVMIALALCLILGSHVTSVPQRDRDTGITPNWREGSTSEASPIQDQCGSYSAKLRRLAGRATPETAVKSGAQPRRSPE